MTRRGAVFRLVAVASLAGCITDPVSGRSVIGMPTSESEESAMGVAYRPAIMQQYSGAYPDQALQDHCAAIVLGMAHHSVRPDLPWQFTILNSSVPNAFAVPGGQVFITRGLLSRLDDEAEFAVVMGHEIGHVEHRHTVQAMGMDTVLSTVAGIGGSLLGGGLASQGLAAGKNLFSLSFSRDEEREADVRGVNNSYHAGYDPRRGADVFRKFLAMKKEEGGGELSIDAWTSSHPLDSERIGNIMRLSAEIDPRLSGKDPVADLRVQTGTFAEAIAKLRGEQKVYDRHDKALAAAGKGGAAAIRKALPELEACADALPSHAFFANTMGKAYAAVGDLQNAKSWFERAAGMGQELLEPEYGLAILSLQAKSYDEAVAHAERGLAILPDYYGCLYVRGEANFAVGRTAEAQADFNKVVQSAPKQSHEYVAAAARLRNEAPPQQQQQKKSSKRGY